LECNEQLDKDKELIFINAKHEMSICEKCKRQRPNGYHNEIISNKKVSFKNYFCYKTGLKISRKKECEYFIEKGTRYRGEI